MPVIINGTTGISGVDGSAGTPAFQGSDANTGIRFGTDIVSLVTGGSDRLYIDSSGRLGVGTSSPSSALEVAGAISLANVAIPSAGTARIFSRNTDSNLYIQTGSGSTLYLLDGSQNTTAAFGSSTVTLQTANTARLTIDSSGRVGIGTATPRNTLDVNGTIYVTGGNQIQITGSGGTTGLQLIGQDAAESLIGTMSSQSLVFRTNSSERARIDSSGRLLVGASTGAGKFIVQDSLPKIQSNFNGTNHLEFGVGGSGCGFAMTTGLFMTFNHQPYADRGTDNNLTERMRIGSNGAVQIGSNGQLATERFRVTSSSTWGAAIECNNNASGDRNLYLTLGTNTNNTSSYFIDCTTATVGPKFYVYGNGTYGTVSDVNLKKNVETTRDGYLEDLRKLRVVKYNWKTDQENTPKELGWIAQELEQIFPGLVQDSQPDADGNTVKEVKTSVLPFILLKALQEAASKIETLEAKVATLEAS